MNISFWERQSFLQYDFVVIGSGIVGLSTAAALKEQMPLAEVLVLERGIFPTGASTKNAGFACIGSLTEILEDLQCMSAEEVISLVGQRRKGLEVLRKRLGDEAIDYQELGSYELIGAAELEELEELERINDLLEPLLEGKAFQLLPNHRISDFGFSTEKVRAVVSNQFEGQIDTGRMMGSLLRYVQGLGVQIINGAEVVRFEERNGGMEIEVKATFSEKSIFFKANKLAVCTNAFSKQLLPDVDLKPGRGQVLITQPIDKLKFKGIFHFDKGYYYFRNIGKRVLFGGGRNLDIGGESTTELEENPLIMQDLIQKLETLILPDTAFEVDMKWAGIMAFGKDKVPILRHWKESGRVVIGVRLGGMGVAIGSDMGRQIAQMLL